MKRAEAIASGRALATVLEVPSSIPALKTQKLSLPWFGGMDKVGASLTQCWTLDRLGGC